jgi:hypothetical protein
MRDDYNYQTQESTTYRGHRVLADRSTNEIWFGGKWYDRDEQREALNAAIDKYERQMED